VLSAAFALLFAFGAAVQWNDPDPLRWMAAYLAVSTLCVAAATGRVWIAPSALVFATLVVWLAVWSPAMQHTSLEALQSFGMSGAEAEEEVREAWGLALLVVWTGVLLVTALRRSRPSPPAT
jgi:hypothetical protein